MYGIPLPRPFPPPPPPPRQSGPTDSSYLASLSGGPNVIMNLGPLEPLPPDVVAKVRWQPASVCGG